MDATTAQLAALFQHALAAEPGIRTQAEQGLRQAEAHDGVLQALMRLVMDTAANSGVRKNAAIFFKNRVQKGWRDPPATPDADVVLVGPNDRAFVRAHIVTAVIEVQQDLSVFFLSALERILQKDYKQWPQFLPSAIALLDPKNPPATVYGGLMSLHALTKSLFHMQDPAEQYKELISSCFSGLHAIALGLLPQTTPEAAAMLRLIVKIYLKTISRDLPPSLQDSSSLVPWGTLFVNIIEKDLSFLNETIANEEEREKHQWWKVKKWAFRCLHMYLMRYCSRRDEVEYAPFANMFISHFAPGIATAYLSVVNKCISGMWVTRHVRQQLSTFLADCVKYKSTWAVMKPHAVALVTQYAYPQMCFSEADAQLWEEDSIEYVQKKMGDYSYEERVNPVEAAEYLLHAIVSKRFKQVFGEILQFIMATLQGTADASTNEASARRKCGALRVILSICDTVMDEKVFSVIFLLYSTKLLTSTSQLLSRNLQSTTKWTPSLSNMSSPEFKSRFGFMRAIAFEALLMFDGVVFSEEYQKVILEAVLAGVQDPELPVKVYAAQTISLIIEYKAIANALKPYVPAMMQTLLTLTSEIDMDTLTSGMENLAAYFPDELAPFSVQLCTQMCESFISLVKDITAAGEDDFEKTLSPLETAAGILKAICSLISAVENAPQILKQLDDLLVPVIVEVLKNGFSDLITECMDVVNALVGCSRQVTLLDWQVWTELFAAYNREDIVFIEDIVDSVDNFIRYGKDHILANPNIAMEMMEMVKKILTPDNDSMEDEDRSFGCMIAESLLLNLRGHLDPFIPQFVGLALNFLKHEKDLQTNFKVHLLELIINCLYHSPLQTLQFLEASNATGTFFYIWFKELDEFSRVHDKKISILALTALLGVPVQNIPSLQGHVGTLLQSLLRLFGEYPKALEIRKEYMKELTREDDDDDDENEEQEQSASEEPKEDDGDASDDDDDYVRFMGQNRDFEDYGDFMGLEEDPYFETPLDTVDPYIEFARFLKSCPPDHVLMTAMNAEQQTVLQGIVATAEANQRQLEEDARTAAAAAAAAAAQGKQ
ncbi:armadillo-type protein [Obelidium mucronatum]|nr:armadillo-type protein [Obelidium mucronatum]